MLPDTLLRLNTNTGSARGHSGVSGIGCGIDSARGTVTCCYPYFCYVL